MHVEKSTISGLSARLDSHSAILPVTVQYFLGSLGQSEGEGPPWRVSLLIVSRVVSFKTDIGADVSVISEPQWKKMCPRPRVHASQAKLQSPGSPVQNFGQFTAKTEFKRKHTSFFVFFVLERQN